MIAAGVSAAGLFSLLQTVPGATEVMKIVASIYLVYLAYKIAFAPVGQSPDAGPASFEPKAGGRFSVGDDQPEILYFVYFTDGLAHDYRVEQHR